MRGTTLTEAEKIKHGRRWQMIFAGIMLLFIGIMIAVYLIAKQADPVILDEKGRPLHGRGY